MGIVEKIIEWKARFLNAIATIDINKSYLKLRSILRTLDTFDQRLLSAYRITVTFALEAVNQFYEAL